MPKFRTSIIRDIRTKEYTTGVLTAATATSALVLLKKLHKAGGLVWKEDGDCFEVIGEPEFEVTELTDEKGT